MAIRSPATVPPAASQNGVDVSVKYSFVQQSMTHPKFLHSNSTSHIWAFGAIAELIDNATDPDVRASKFWIDVEEDKGQPILCFTDNGYGMEVDKLYKMLSFGYCEKVEVDGHKPIGHYGNGFKSGSMRLGKDALVFTRSKSTFSIGMLSQTFLLEEKATSVLVPMVTWDAAGKCLTDFQAAEQCLLAIQSFSPFKTIQEIMNRFKKIPGSTKSGTGTHIVIYNLRTTSNEPNAPLELDFKTDPKDIRIANIMTQEGKRLHFQQHRTGQGSQVEIPIDFSLREYCSILYLKPRMIINLRGKNVRTKLVESSLGSTMFDTYKKARITFGINVDQPNLYGIMLYHRNRLIKPYLRLGIQNQINPDAVGVIGIIEADFLQPTHNKQDFDVNTNDYKNCISTLANKLETYWKSYKNKSINPSAESNFSRNQIPDTWVQCEDCNKWRRLPMHIKPESLPEHWYCRDNTGDPRHNTCDAPEENQMSFVVEHSGDLKQVRAEERKREKEAKKREEERLKEAEARRRAEDEAKRRQFEEQQQILRLREEELQRKNREIEEIKRIRDAKRKEKEAKRQAELDEEKRRAAQAEALKRVNNELSGQRQTPATNAETPSASASMQVPRPTVQPPTTNNIQVKTEPTRALQLNSTAAQTQIQNEEGDSRKRKRDENGAVDSEEHAVNKAQRTEASKSPRRSTSENGLSANSTANSTAAPTTNGDHSSHIREQDDESLITTGSSFGTSLLLPTLSQMQADDSDQFIDLNVDASIDLMAESSSQPSGNRSDLRSSAEVAAPPRANDAVVTGLMNNMQKLLKAYSIIVPEHAEQLSDNLTDPAGFAALNLDPLIMALTKKRSSEQMAAKTAERELIGMQRKVRELLAITNPESVADVESGQLYPLFCDWIAKYRSQKEK